MTHNDLHEAIRKESAKARTKTNEAFDCMVRMGHMLIELKARINRGSFMVHAEHATGLPQRSINRYMAIARDPDGFRNRRRGIPAEEMLTLTKKAPASHNRIEHETKVDTVSILPAVESPSPRLPQITVDAVIVEPKEPIEKDALFQAGLDRLQETMPPVEFVDLLEMALAKNPEAERLAVLEEKVDSGISKMEAEGTILPTILAMLPRLKPEEITELHRVIESRWMKGGPRP
jgi:hypothetical protein